MIDTKELRLKNIVRFIDGQISTVEAIGLGSVELKEVPYSVIDTGISPIPLTPEVLEACGFIKNAFHQLIDNRIVNGAYRRYYFKERPCRGTEGIMNALYQENRYGDEFIAYCRYLHSLQNIYYALLGEELTIDIDKLKNAVK